MFRRIVTAVALSSVGLLLPVSTYAGGGVGGGGVGGGGFAGGAAIQVDGATVPGHNYEFDAFYPHVTTVHQGDVVSWQFAPDINAFHTITLLPAGKQPSARLYASLFPAANSPVPDRDDPGRKIGFAFNTFQQAGCGNSAYFPGTAPCLYTGSSVVNAGIQAPPTNPKTNQIAGGPAVASALGFRVAMSVPAGAYYYFCLVHGPSMSGVINVVPQSAPIPSAAQQAARAQAEYQGAVAYAEKVEAGIKAHLPPPRPVNGHNNWTVMSGAQAARVAIDEFIPENIHVKPGDTVTWTPGFHTVSFPRPGPYNAATSIGLECEGSGSQDTAFRGFQGCSGAEAILVPRAVFPSGPPGQPYTGGFSNSGVLVIPKPHLWSASFPQSGTFGYMCYIHFAMQGNITTG